MEHNNNPIPRGNAMGGKHGRGEMLTVTCFDGKGGKVRVQIPLKYKALVSKYATFSEDRGWLAITPFQVWIHLPGAVKES